MGKFSDWSEPIFAASSRLTQGFVEYLPQFVSGIAILILGYLIAKAARALAIRLVNSFDRLSHLPGFGDAASKPIDAHVVAIIGNVVFWLIILFFLTSATNLLGLNMFAGWFDRVISHLPNILSGVLIIFAGVVIGNLVKDSVETAAKSMPPRQRALLSRSAQAFTVTTMIVIGIDQIGIDITVLITIMAVGVGALLGGIAIAFSLGSRTMVSNLIAARYLHRDYRVGELIRIGEIEGTILEISSVAVILDTEDGRMTIPAKAFSEETSLLVNRGKNNVG